MAYFTVYSSISAYVEDIGNPPSCADPPGARFLAIFVCPPTTAYEGGMTVLEFISDDYGIEAIVKFQILLLVVFTFRTNVLPILETIETLSI